MIILYIFSYHEINYLMEFTKEKVEEQYTLLCTSDSKEIRERANKYIIEFQV